jgi:hypothetical protein
VLAPAKPPDKRADRAGWPELAPGTLYLYFDSTGGGLTTEFLLAGIHAVLTGGLDETGNSVTAVITAQKLARRTLKT